MAYEPEPPPPARSTRSSQEVQPDGNVVLTWNSADHSEAVRPPHRPPGLRPPQLDRGHAGRQPVAVVPAPEPGDEGRPHHRRRDLAARRHPQRLHLPQRPVRRSLRPAHRARARQRRHPGLGQRLPGRPVHADPDVPRPPRPAPALDERPFSRVVAYHLDEDDAHAHLVQSSTTGAPSASSPARPSGSAPGRSRTTCSSAMADSHDPDTNAERPDALRGRRGRQRRVDPGHPRLLLLPRPEVPRTRRHRPQVTISGVTDGATYAAAQAPTPELRVHRPGRLATWTPASARSTAARPSR